VVYPGSPNSLKGVVLRGKQRWRNRRRAPRNLFSSTARRREVNRLERFDSPESLRGTNQGGPSQHGSKDQGLGGRPIPARRRNRAGRRRFSGKAWWHLEKEEFGRVVPCKEARKEGETQGSGTIRRNTGRRYRAAIKKRRGGKDRGGKKGRGGKPSLRSERMGRIGKAGEVFSHFDLIDNGGRGEFRETT